MRLLLVGAFPYPHDQGSQVYFQEQAIALRSAGAEVSLLTYASRAASTSDPTTSTGPERALEGFAHRTPPRWTSPRSLRSGPSWGKPLADLALAMTLRDAVASRSRHDAYDAILTHHAEAALSALLALGVRRRGRPAIVYCAHTLLGNELSFYLKRPLDRGHTSDGTIENAADDRSGRIPRSLDRAGGAIDHWIAARADGWIALTLASERVMRHASRMPGALIPPPIPDPGIRSGSRASESAARRHGLDPGRFFLYAGNRDAYQELDLLEAVARERPRPASGMRLVMASHPDHDPQRVGRPRVIPTPGIDVLRIDSADEMFGLMAAARASLVLRRIEGGFPIKLANSLAVGTPPIAFRGAEWGLTDDRNSLICQTKQPVPSLIAAIERLSGDDAIAARLSEGARLLYEDRHRPERVASRTLALLDEILAFRRR